MGEASDGVGTLQAHADSDISCGIPAGLKLVLSMTYVCVSHSCRTTTRTLLVHATLCHKHRSLRRTTTILLVPEVFMRHSLPLICFGITAYAYAPH